MSSIEEIDNIDKNISKIYLDFYLNNKPKFDKNSNSHLKYLSRSDFLELFNQINLSENNILDCYEKFNKNQIYLNYADFDKIASVFMEHKDFNINWIYKYPSLPWDYYAISNFKDVSPEFILSNLDKDWNFDKMFSSKILTFPQIMEIFKFKINENRNSPINYKIRYLLHHYKDFDFSILSFDYSSYIIESINMDEFIEHPKFEMYYVRTYPQFNWNWDLLTLHGKMTMEEAIKFLSYSENKENKENKENHKFSNKMRKYFDNLMFQPWMNSWFIKRYISDPDDRRFYLRKIQKGKEGKIRSKNEELKWELVAKAMSPERIFDWYLDIYELDNEFQDVLPEGHPRKKHN